MRKAIVFFLGTLLAIGVFVSCDNDNASRFTVLVKFDVEVSLPKDLSSSVQYPAKEDLDWYYKAIPGSWGLSGGNVMEWTPFELGSEIALSVGSWSFEIKGVAKGDSTKVAVYQGATEFEFNAPTSEVVTVPVDVSINNEGMGTIVFKSDIKILLENGNGEISPTYARIDEGKAFALSSNEDVSEAVSVGEHEVTIWYDSPDNPLSAEETIVVTVHNSAVVTIQGTISSQGYYVSDHESLAKALEAAPAGSTITLNNNIYVVESLLIDRSISLNGGGNTITSGRSNIFIIDGGEEYIDVALDDITIIGDRDFFGEPEGSAIVANAVNLTLGDDVTVVADGYGSALTASANEAYDMPGKVNINGAKIVLVGESLEGGALSVGNGASITVESGIIDSSDSLMAAVVYSTGGTINIKNGEIKGYLYAYESESPEKISTIMCSGGTYSEDFGKYTPPGYSSVYNEVNGNYELKEGIWNETALNVAIEANLNSIVIDSDFPISEMIVFGRGSEKDITIDLNGKTLTGEEGVDAVFKVYEDGKLTIGGGSINSYGAVIFNRGGEVEILDGTYTQRGTAVSNPSTYRYAIKTYIGTTTIQGGTFTSANGVLDVGGEEGGIGELIINGGIFSKIDCAATRHLAYVNGLANLTINDGEFNAVINSSAGGNCILLDGVIEGTTVDINGGRFSCVYSSGAQCPFYSGSQYADIEIRGGLFSNNIGMNGLVVDNTDEATKEQYPYKANTAQ